MQHRAYTQQTEHGGSDCRRSAVAVPKQQGGFTLLEVVLAFALFALTFATVMQILSASLRNTTRSAEFTEAALWAQTKLDTLQLEGPLEESGDAGIFDDRFSWEMVVTPYQVDDQGAVSSDLIPLSLMLVDLYVYWETGNNDQTARFTTLRAIDPERQR